MDKKIFNNLSYGLFVLTAHENGRDNGCIINTAAQLASEPLTISIAVNKANFTCEMIERTKRFTVSVLSEEASFELFKRFGFQSGRDVNKFDGFTAFKRLANGTVAVTEGTNSYISVQVKEQVDLGSHILFLGSPVQGEILSPAKSATYAYYFENIKPRPAAKQEQEGSADTGEKKTIYRCTVCGYEYEGDTLPEDFICPICKHPASDFERVK